MIPSNYGGTQNSYPISVSSTKVTIPFFPQSTTTPQWFIDMDAGYISFPNNDFNQTTYGLPVVSFYRYNGNVGAGGGSGLSLSNITQITVDNINNVNIQLTNYQYMTFSAPSGVTLINSFSFSGTPLLSKYTLYLTNVSGSTLINFTSNVSNIYFSNFSSVLLYPFMKITLMVNYNAVDGNYYVFVDNIYYTPISLSILQNYYTTISSCKASINSTIINTSKTVGETNSLSVGMLIYGNGILPNTTVVSISPTGNIIISQPVTSALNNTMLYFYNSLIPTILKLSSTNQILSSMNAYLVFKPSGDLSGIVQLFTQNIINLFLNSLVYNTTTTILPNYGNLTKAIQTVFQYGSSTLLSSVLNSAFLQQIISFYNNTISSNSSSNMYSILTSAMINQLTSNTNMTQLLTIISDPNPPINNFLNTSITNNTITKTMFANSIISLLDYNNRNKYSTSMSNLFELLYGSQINTITSDQLQLLTSSQIDSAFGSNTANFLSNYNFSTMFTPNQLSLLNMFEIQRLFSPTQLNSLSSTQLQVITASFFTTTQLSNLTTTQISYLLPFQIKSLTIPQIQSLTTNQMQTLSISQIQALTSPQTNSLSSKQIQASIIPIYFQTDYSLGSPTQFSFISSGGINYVISASNNVTYTSTQSSLSLKMTSVSDASITSAAPGRGAFSSLTYNYTNPTNTISIATYKLSNITPLYTNTFNVPPISVNTTIIVSYISGFIVNIVYNRVSELNYSITVTDSINSYTNNLTGTNGNYNLQLLPSNNVSPTISGTLTVSNIYTYISIPYSQQITISNPITNLQSTWVSGFTFSISFTSFPGYNYTVGVVDSNNNNYSSNSNITKERITQQLDGSFRFTLVTGTATPTTSFSVKVTINEYNNLFSTFIYNNIQTSNAPSIGISGQTDNIFSNYNSGTRTFFADGNASFYLSITPPTYTGLDTQFGQSYTITGYNVSVVARRIFDGSELTRNNYPIQSSGTIDITSIRYDTRNFNIGADVTADFSISCDVSCITNPTTTYATISATIFSGVN